MYYFLLSQNLEILNRIKPTSILKALDNNVLQLKQKGMDQLPIQVELKPQRNNVYVDFIARPLPLISDPLKELFEKYQADIFFKPVVLFDPQWEDQILYWIMIPESVGCLSQASQFNRNGAVEKIVIDSKRAAGANIFKIAETVEPTIVVNLAVAESILRRDFIGIDLKKVEVD